MLEYFTEIDAILLEGQKFNSVSQNISQNKWSILERRGRIIEKLEKDNFEPCFVENREHVFQDFLKNELKNFIELDENLDDNEQENGLITIKDLPVGVCFMHKIV